MAEASMHAKGHTSTEAEADETIRHVTHRLPLNWASTREKSSAASGMAGSSALPKGNYFIASMRVHIDLMRHGVGHGMGRETGHPP